MSQSSSESLQFSINESVWLRNDAPAEEILSMALEPDITVEENWNDVTIKGFLRLTGEYKPANSPADAVEDKTAPFRTIDEIIETTSGTAVLEHHFPIDITIPADRVPNLEELFVVIESFDYELSEHRHIQLQADIAITGLTGSNRSEKKAQPPQKPAAVIPPAPVPEKPAAKKKPAAESNKIKKSEKIPNKPEKAENPPENIPEKAEKAAKSAPEKAGEAKKKEKGTAENAVEAKQKAKSKPENVSEVKKKAKKEAPKASAPAEKAGKKTKKAPKRFGDQETDDALLQLPEEIDEVADDFDPMPTDREFDYDEDQEAEEFQYEAFRKPEPAGEENTPQVAFGRPGSGAPVGDGSGRYAPETGRDRENGLQDEKQSSRPEEANSLYLTKVLAGNDAEQQTQMKICIVQAGESLENISERYQVPVTSLLRRNALSSADIEAGQILYIPVIVKGNRNER